MKNIIKSRVFTFILGAIIFGSIGVYAATQYNASQITYNKNGKATVEAALNDLYTKNNNKLTLVHDLSDNSTESIVRKSTETRTFSVEANQIYYIFCEYYMTGYSDNRIVSSENISMSFAPSNSVQVLNDSNIPNVVKIKAINSGNITATLTNLGDDNSNFRGKLFMKVYK